MLTLLKPLEDHLSDSNATYETLLIKRTIISQNENLQYVNDLKQKVGKTFIQEMMKIIKTIENFMNIS